MLSQDRRAVHRRKRREAGYKEYKIYLTPEKAALVKSLAERNNMSISRFIHTAVDVAMTNGNTA